jgi:hypothetical protein
MADRKVATYPAGTDLTITIASIVSSASLVAGQQSTSISNATNKYLDYLVSGKITTGTSPTASRQIEVWCIPKAQAATPIWPAGLGATNAALPSLTREQILGIGQLIFSTTTTATSNQSYDFSNAPLSRFYGRSIPQEFVLAVIHSTGVNLNATAGNHFLTLQGTFETIA